MTVRRSLLLVCLVAAAHGLFSVLTERVKATPSEELLAARVRVPARTKLAVLARTLMPARPL